MILRAVLDTNIWVASIRWRGRSCRIRKLAEQREFNSVLSLAILAEITRVLREYFGLSDEEVYEWHCRIGASSDVVAPTRFLNAIPDDPDDNKFVECAIKGRAKYIVSRDNDLLRLGQYDTVQIVDDAEFLDILLSSSLEEKEL
ncbi:MAG: putative toxin-antitoxin system toxin component, PIN family [Chloroflexota bacterium]|nr:putative toxin-antitoxin system toxin component, PIN family [Chloroflexota bacterium]